MITSENQLNVTKTKISDLKESLKSSQRKDVKAVFASAARLQTEALIKDLEAQVEEYNSLKDDGVKAIKILSPSDWLLLPIRFRIAKRMTRDSFSKLVGVSERQIARYEAEDYENIQSDTLKQILEKLPISVANAVIVEKR